MQMLSPYKTGIHGELGAGLVRGPGGCGNVTGRRGLEHKQPQCDASHNLILAI